MAGGSVETIASGDSAALRGRPCTQAARLVAALAVGISGAGFTFLACSHYETTVPQHRLTVSPSIGHVNVGGSMQLSVSGANGPIVWTSSDQSVASVSFGKVQGVGSGTATIRALSGGAVAISKISVTRSAAIAIDATSKTFNAVATGVLPDSQTIDITNTGEDALDGIALGAISYGPGANGWLSARVTGTSAPAKLVLKPNSTALAVGSYTASLTVGASTATNGPLTVSVSFTVIRPAAIVLGSTSALFSVQENSATIPAQQQIAVTNGGDAPLTGLAIGTITYSAGANNWLTASVSPATAPATVFLRPNTTALAPGDYTATVPVTSSVAGVAAVPVTVTYHVDRAPTPPVIVLSTATLSFSATSGSSVPPSQPVNVTNGGEVALTGLSTSTIYTPGQPTNWLDVSLNSTTAPATITVRPNTTVIAAGTYTATVRVSTTIAGVASKDVTVTYTVVNPPAIGLTATSASFLSTATNSNPAAQQIGVSNSGGGTLTGLAANVTFTPGEPSGWLAASVASTAPLAPSTTPLTLTVTTGSIFPGTYTATVTLSAPGVTSRNVTVTFTRQATLAGDVQPIFSASCASCHGSPGADGVNLSTASASFTSLINNHSSDNTAILVVPGNVAGSYLVNVVNGTALSSDNMPIGCLNGNASCLPLTSRQLITVWIQQGARQNP